LCNTVPRHLSPLLEAPAGGSSKKKGIIIVEGIFTQLKNWRENE